MSINVSVGEGESVPAAPLKGVQRTRGNNDELLSRHTRGTEAATEYVEGFFLGRLFVVNIEL